MPKKYWWVPWIISIFALIAAVTKIVLVGMMQ